ncbi:MAG: YibE/F family protein [Cyanobacteria bacterium RYN_339]|nr:YibE/F family protein [Cyanobacteria bacterium RYN_339]
MPVRLLLTLMLLALAGGPAWAQDADVEVPAGAATPGPMAGTIEPIYETATVKTVAPGATPADKHITIELTGGAHPGTTVEVLQHLSGQAGFDLPVVPGDEIVVAELPDPLGVQAQYQIADYQRAKPTGALLAFVALLLLLIGGLRGLKTLGVLALTGVAVVGVLLPLTVKGVSPLPVAVGLAAAIALVTTLLTSGPGRKSWAAVAGTTAGAAIAALVGVAAAHFTRLSGVASEEAVGAQAVAHGTIDFTGLLVAGMVVGALGVMLDMALSISSAVDELAEANPGLERGLLLQAGLQVGRDLLSTSSNTLFLAYLGSFLPVLLALGSSGLAGPRLWHQETLAAEAATLAIGLVGLLAALPLTALIATWLQPARR